MPDLVDDSTPETPTPAVAIPPIIDPARFEDFPGFRETSLHYVTDPDANAILRDFGGLFYDMMLEYSRNWPHHPEGYVRAQLRSAVADMRVVQGFLAAMKDDAGAEDHDGHLCRVGVKAGRAVGELADQIEAELGSWRGSAEVEP